MGQVGVPHQQMMQHSVGCVAQPGGALGFGTGLFSQRARAVNQGLQVGGAEVVKEQAEGGGGESSSHWGPRGSGKSAEAHHKLISGLVKEAPKSDAC
jgi:hypothetical protein